MYRDARDARGQTRHAPLRPVCLCQYFPLRYDERSIIFKSYANVSIISEKQYPFPLAESPSSLTTAPQPQHRNRLTILEEIQKFHKLNKKQKLLFQCINQSLPHGHPPTHRHPSHPARASAGRRFSSNRVHRSAAEVCPDK